MLRLYLSFKHVFGSKLDNWVPPILILLLLRPIWSHGFTRSVRRLKTESRAGRDRIIWLFCTSLNRELRAVDVQSVKNSYLLLSFYFILNICNGFYPRICFFRR